MKIAQPSLQHCCIITTEYLGNYYSGYDFFICAADWSTAETGFVI